MTVNAFIGLVKRHKLEFINYCEVLIDERGHVFLANPSHQQALIKLVASKTKRAPREICNEIPTDCNPNEYLADKYNIVLVWYEHLNIPLNVNDVQIESLRKLSMMEIISKQPKLACADEYHRALWRDKLFTLFNL